MSGVLLAAAVLAALTAAIHSFVGGRDVVRPLLASSLAEEPRRTLYGCWHIVTVLLVASAAVLFYLAFADSGASRDSLARFIALIHLASGCVFVAVALSARGPRRLLRFPQWALLLPIGALAWAGTL